MQRDKISLLAQIFEDIADQHFFLRQKLTNFRMEAVMGSFLTQTAGFGLDGRSHATNIKKLLETSEISRIHTEHEWRRPQILEDMPAREWKGLVSKWTDPSTKTREESISARPTHYTIGLAMRRTNATLSLSGAMVHHGEISSGMSHICGPNDSAHAIFRAPCDFIHLHISKSFVSQCFDEAEISLSPELPSFSKNFCKDATIEQLMRSLAVPQIAGPAMGHLYMEGVCLAVVARLIAAQYDRSQTLDKPKIAALANWRLKRALEYIEANIAEPITLADVAASTGLTRMYFAAQFKAATGTRPHEYILRRRIERAQDMLLTSNVTLIDAALSVGFQTQAHFTTVFKKMVGDTPYRWREANLQRSAASAGKLRRIGRAHSEVIFGQETGRRPASVNAGADYGYVA